MQVQELIGRAWGPNGQLFKRTRRGSHNEEAGMIFDGLTHGHGSTRGHGSIQTSRFWLLLLAGSLIVTVTALKSFQGIQGGNAKNLSVTYWRGILRATVPYPSRSGTGQLTVEVLDPDDAVLGSIERAVEVGKAEAGKEGGAWQEDITLAKPLALEDLAWQRLRYKFTYSGEANPAVQDTESISQILRMPVVHILGQQSYFSGGQAAVRVIVTDSKNEPISGAGSVRIEINSKVLFTGALNQRGTAEAQFQFPAGLVGNFPVHYAVDTAIGSAEYTQQVRLEDKASILLTTEKPLYQPGQTIHVRALALDRSNRQASANRALTFEMEDPRGNKVFKKATQTDSFGVASAEFALADEVNLGTYHLRAQMETNKEELALNVERYVLPKFKVAIEFAGGESGPGSNKTHGYRPGDHVTGTVRANYFFGKPADDAEITVKASGMDVAKFEAGSVQGKTDREGVYHFDFTLPKYFAGRPLSQGAARLLVEATVKDSADHSETRGEPIVVSESPLIVTAVPEGGTLIPHLENQVFVLTSYADGKPASATVRIHGAGMPVQTAVTDEGGVAIVRLPAGAGENLQIEASDRDGNQSTTPVTLQTRPGQDQILLRTERAIYRAGDRIALKVLSTKTRGSAYIDVVKEGQIVLTRDIDIENGQGELVLTATPELAGAVDVSAYQFGGDARPVADHRMIFVQPADELKIETTADAASYKPGGDARIRFRVTNSRGEGVQAALGLQVVDEAVFALAEKQPGFAEVFFYLEQEAMKPRYEIHSIGMADVVAVHRAGGRGGDQPREQQRDLAARALFSATELVSTNRFETEVGRTSPQTKYAVYAPQYRTRFEAQLHNLAESASRVYAGNPSAGDLPQVIAKLDPRERQDAWGTDFRIEAGPQPRQVLYTVRSAGPDKQFNTADDLFGYFTTRVGNVLAPKQSEGEIKIEHDRGPFNGMAELAGLVVDLGGSPVAQAPIDVTSLTRGVHYLARTGVTGQFSVSALPPDDYEVNVDIHGSPLLIARTTLQARDRGVLTVSVVVSQTIEVMLAIPPQVAAIGGLGVAQAGAGRGGGGGGGGRGGARALAVPGAIVGTGNAPAPLKMALNIAQANVAQAEAPEAHVRSYFPEALYINPEIITDKDGRASIEIPLADSITTWRMAMLASTAQGALGSGTSSIKVFQDFFVDLDLPVTLTQGDRVSIPVAVYNYSGSSGDAHLELHPDDWFSLVSDTSAKTVAVESGRVGAAQFTLEAKRIGKFKLTLSASMKGGTNLKEASDIVVREIEVVPNGREQTEVFNGRLDSAAAHEVTFPATAIPDASKLFVRLYPGPLSQIIEGMDAILRMPNGCFEQTSSSTYPNVLALDYMKTTKKLTPEVHAKAEGFIVSGYQRLLTFEVPGGGFSWFGQAPANKILTSYGLMEFYDMSKVHDVDPKLIQRTQQWLAAQQQPDGSWKPDTGFINEGATNRFNTDVLRISAYIAWALENTGYQGPAVERAKQFIVQHADPKTDPYTLAVLANFAADYGKDREFTRQAVQRLLDARTEKDEQAWWDAPETAVHSTGSSAAIETTGLAVQALLKSGENSGVASKALAYIASKKNAAGSWGTTQATIMALRAILLSTSKGASDVRGAVEISLNGKVVQKLTLTPDNNDLLHQFVFKSADLSAANRVSLKFTGTGGLAYQVAGSYFTPWQEKPAAEPLSIDVKYDRTNLAEDDVATATATVKNNLGKSANMVMVDLGIPPGFDLLGEDLQSYQEKSSNKASGRLEKFSLTATQAILYFDSIAAGDTVTLKFRLHAKYPIRARTFASRVYEYYDPEVSAVAQPAQLEVHKR
jgi:uncharacterized protein YfaS (alpha-2-macroglobulin family)